MRTIFVLLGLLAASVTVKAQTLTSPDGNFKMQFHLSDEGKPVYSLIYKEKEVIKESKMGFQISPSIAFDRNFSVVETKIDSCDTVWKTVWGQNSEIRDHHKELWVALKQEKSGRLLNIRFRLFNDGLGFRYEFPVQSNLRHFTLKEELTEFQLAGNHKAFWIPADYDTNEFQITTSRLSEVPLLIDEARNEPLACKSPTPNLAETARGPLIDTITILLGLTVGASTQASEFLTVDSLKIFGLGALSFVIATASGVIFVKIFNLILPKGDKINPLIGNAGVSAVPDSARISQVVGLEYDPSNYLLMHAMGPNVAGVIGSAVAAGILLGFLI